jgi:hypothetical protein
MPSLADMVQGQQPSHPEVEDLFLPSYFSSVRRDELDIAHLAKEEGLLREGQACDTIMQLRRAVKTLSALQSRRKKNEEHQKQQTRARSRIQGHEHFRDGLLATYSSCRQALTSLEYLSDPQAKQRYPVLTVNDLDRKSTFRKRSIGDSHRADGELWTALTVPTAKGADSYQLSADAAVDGDHPDIFSMPLFLAKTCD